MPSIFAEKTLFGRKSRQILLAGVAGGTLVLGSGAFVSAQDADGLGAIIAAEDEKPCENTEDGAVWLDVVAENRQAACAEKANESAEVVPEDIDLGGDAYVEDDDALSDEEAAVLRSLSDEEANEVATLFDEEDSDPQETAEVGTTAQEDVAALEEPTPAQSDEDDIGMDEGATLAEAPRDDAEGDESAQSGSGEAEAFDSAEAGSNSAAYGGTIQGTGSLVAVGVGDGLSNALNDPTSLDSLADVVVGTDPNNGNKDNVAQVTALGGVTDGALAVTVLEGIDGDMDDPLGQVLAVDADNAPSGPGAVPSIDGIAEVNVGDDPDGQSFNVVQVDAFDDNFLPDGSTGLANVAVGDGLDEGFGSLVGLSIGGNNDGEHDDLANIALGESFDPLAEPLSPLTGGVNDLGATLGQGLAPLLAPLAGALP